MTLHKTGIIIHMTNIFIAKLFPKYLYAFYPLGFGEKRRSQTKTRGTT
jgi:hypothetical protein